MAYTMSWLLGLDIRCRMLLTTSYIACYMNNTYDMVYLMLHRMSEHQVSTVSGNDAAPHPPQLVSTWAWPFLCFAYYFYAAQSDGTWPGRYETRACPLADAQKGHGHMGQR
jgi:hypothetical protein